MAKRRPQTIKEYIAAPPAHGKPHLLQIYSILKDIAPNAEETIKWGHPFFIEPRFLFSFTAHKEHAGLMTSRDAIEPFLDELHDYEITNMGILKIPYGGRLPKAVIKKIAPRMIMLVSQRMDHNFW